MSIRLFSLLGLFFVFLNSVFVVSEGQKGLATRFTKIVNNSDGSVKVYEPGLHFKLPIIDKIKLIDSRIQTLSGKADRFITARKKDVMVDSYVKWRVSDFAKFFLSTRNGNISFANQLLQSKVNNTLRGEFGSRSIKDIVSGERDELQKESLSLVSVSSKDLGMEIVDVRVKQINLPPQVSMSIYKRMREERLAVAQEHRAKGHKKAEFIKAASDKKVKVLIAEASRDSLKIRGEGDAIAAHIYSESYSKNPSFFNYYRSLQSYKDSFKTKNDIMVVSPDSPYFKDMGLIKK